MSQQRPAFSLRNVPPAIYLGLGINVIGMLVFVVTSIAFDGEWEKLQRWWAFNDACGGAQVFLVSLGIFTLAKRYTGGARSLALTGGWLLLVQLAWSFNGIIFEIVKPHDYEVFNQVFGGLVGLATIAAFVLVSIAADAWRRVPIAAAGIAVLLLTSHWTPVIGPGIAKAFGEHRTISTVYYSFRELAAAAAWLFVIASLAAGGRDPAPDVRLASAGFRLAHSSVIMRVLVAISMVLGGFAVRTPGAAKLMLVVGPGVMFASLVMFVIGLERVAASNADGMPRWRFSLGALAIMWWGMLQLSQVLSIVVMLFDHDDLDRATKSAELFSIAGPIVVALGLGMVGSGIVAFANSRADLAHARSAQSRTFWIVGLSLAGVGLQAGLVKVGSLGGALLLGVTALGLAIAGLVMLLGLLRLAAEQTLAAPGIAPARVVSDS